MAFPTLRLRYVAIPVCAVLTFYVATRLRWPGSEGDVPAAVGQQRAAWQAHQPQQYILTVDHTSAASASWFTLSKVNKGKLENILCRRNEANGDITECKVSESLYPLTVEQLFDIVETGYRSKFHGVDVQYDARLGYPTSIRFDPREDRNGEEWGYAIELSELKDGG